MALDSLAPGQSARVTAVVGEGELRRHLLDMGLIPGVVVTLQKVAPMGDPLQVRLRGECVKEVKRLNGSFSFEDAYHYNSSGWITGDFVDEPGARETL